VAEISISLLKPYLLKEQRKSGSLATMPGARADAGTVASVDSLLARALHAPPAPEQRSGVE
jgi:hypothetical protein